jgi:hypothetical protein
MQQFTLPHLFLVDSIHSADSMESMRTPLGGKIEILMDSMDSLWIPWIPYGVRGFLMNFPAAFTESTGVLMESMDSTWIPH